MCIGDIYSGDNSAEKNELRDEKDNLKMDKEYLEQQVKTMNAQLYFLSHLSAALAAKGQTASHKLIHCIGYVGIAMRQFMLPAASHKLLHFSSFWLTLLMDT
ncbi:hypothetical protein L6164_020367 [Bauhinia variegata]|uniref:Uncharacterized protein n=1 Tax=Bauhinia variegata TaxID=167791 RepID=A0ACB9MWW1_BAUVA|nr:hypothetical protein L6164_020367 [Bauhinia variegata]